MAGSSPFTLTTSLVTVPSSSSSHNRDERQFLASKKQNPVRAIIRPDGMIRRLLSFTVCLLVSAPLPVQPTFDVLVPALSSNAIGAPCRWTVLREVALVALSEKSPSFSHALPSDTPCQLRSRVQFCRGNVTPALCLARRVLSPMHLYGGMSSWAPGGWAST